MEKKILNGFQEIQQTFVHELKESLKDSGTVLIFVIAVIAYPILYSIGYLNETLRDVPIAVVDLDHSALSRQYCRMVDATEQVKVNAKPGSLKEAEQLFYQGKVYGVFLIPTDFEKNILRKEQTQVVVYCDASKFFLYKQVLSGGTFSTSIFSSGIEYQELISSGKMPEQALQQTDPLQVEVFNLYNPSSGYASFIVPGILFIIIQQSLLVGIGMLTGKRYERMKNSPELLLNQKTKSVIPTVLGKAFAYTTLYLFTSLFLTGLLYKWLVFPARGSFISLYFVLIPYLLAVAFAGQSIGVLFRKRVSALMFIIFISPAVFFFSGISWPVQSMPWLIRILTFLFPSSPMIPAFVKLRVIGGGLNSITYEWTLLLVQMVIYFLIACFALRMSRERK